MPDLVILGLPVSTSVREKKFELRRRLIEKVAKLTKLPEDLVNVYFSDDMTITETEEVRVLLPGFYKRPERDDRFKADFTWTIAEIIGEIFPTATQVGVVFDDIAVNQLYITEKDEEADWVQKIPFPTTNFT
ncbi:hypothetical protein ACFL2B_01135 [Patescibacteria group bacterium]